MMRVAFHTLGCKVNQYETAVMEGQFAAAGYSLVEEAETAEVYVVNSCTVTGESDRKCRQALRRFRRQNPDAVICLCGCMPQAFPQEAEALGEADIVVGASRRSRLVEAVGRFLVGSGRIVDIAPQSQDFEPMQTSAFSARTRAYVKIQDGCERYCSYCIIPHARGPVRSKPLKDLKEELEGLAQNGYREVVLVGINLSCYGQDLGLRLLDAIRLACSVDGIARVRLGSLEPELLTDRDIAAMARLPKLCPQFHLSLQSGCDETLRRMNRHYDTAEYRRIVAALRASFENCAVTTDMMVGFPGETEEEHQESCRFAKEIGFARVHVFAYSPRPGTPAAERKDQVPKPVKTERSRQLARVTAETQRVFFRSQLTEPCEVLFETRLEDGRWEGYSANYTPVRVPSLDNLGGQVWRVRLLEVEEDGCAGILLPE